MKTYFRAFVGLSCIFLILSCGGEGSKESTSSLSGTKRFVRKNANSPEAARDLEAMKVALEKMRDLDCSDPRSWYYQSAMHWVPDTIRGANKLCDSYQSYKDLKQAWDNCTHTEDGKEINHFLVWHRMYIYHFEKIVRELSGYPDFALPYWGYTNTEDTLVNRTMPSALREDVSSLFEPARLDTLNKGLPISGKVLRLLNLTQLNSNRTYELFNKNMDRAPHGAMHNYIGFGNDTTGKAVFNRISQENSYGVMSDVATAGFDPVFWLHHSNIDRVWQQWTNSERGQYVTLKDLSAPWTYEFFNEKGKKITYSIEDVVANLYQLDYDFDDTKVYRKETEQLKQLRTLASAVSPQDTLGRLTRSIPLQGKQTKINVGNLQRGQLKLAGTPGEDGHILVMNVTVSFAKPPKADFELYLNVPGNEALDPNSNLFIGFMSFFGADHTHSHVVHSHAGHTHEAATLRRKTTTFSFEITEEAQLTDALTKRTFDVSVLRLGDVAGADVRIEKISVVKH